MSSFNLDKLAAQVSQKLLAAISHGDVDKLEIIATKTLGVVQEQGIYAGMLFLLSKSGTKSGLDINRLSGDEKAACQIILHFMNLLRQQPFAEWNYGLTSEIDLHSVNQKKSDILNKLVEDNCLLDNLDDLFLAKKLFEQILIYTRYGAKADAVQG